MLILFPLILPKQYVYIDAVKIKSQLTLFSDVTHPLRKLYWSQKIKCVHSKNGNTSILSTILPPIDVLFLLSIYEGFQRIVFDKQSYVNVETENFWNFSGNIFQSSLKKLDPYAYALWLYTCLRRHFTKVTKIHFFEKNYTKRFISNFSWVWFLCRDLVWVCSYAALLHNLCFWAHKSLTNPTNPTNP